MSRPAVTIGISFLDEERHLAVAVRSILGQTMKDFELLLVDDGSRDGSLGVARSFSDARITVISDGHRRGLAARLNEIARRARADVVLRMDADDVSHPTRLARALERLRASGADVVGTWAGLFDATNDVFGIVESAPLPPTRAVAIERGIIVHATMLARREWLLENPYDERLLRAEDLDLWCRTAESSSFAVVEEPLYAIRVRADAKVFEREYAYAQRYNRLVFLRHGPRAVGLVRTGRMWLVSHAKTGIVRAFARLGCAERLVHRRGRLPTESERRLVTETIRSATMSAPVASNGVAHVVDNHASRER